MVVHMVKDETLRFCYCGSVADTIFDFRCKHDTDITTIWGWRFQLPIPGDIPRACDGATAFNDIYVAYLTYHDGIIDFLFLSQLCWFYS